MDKVCYLYHSIGDQMTKTYPFLFKPFIILTCLLFTACSQATPSVSLITPTLDQPTVQFLDLSQVTEPVTLATKTEQPTEEPTSTLPPAPTLTAIPVVIVTEAKSGCTNQAEFVKHLSVSDNTAIKPGEFFTKVWQVLNTGTCTWNTDYRLVFIGGEPMQAAETIQLPHEVKPQETVDLRVSLIAPETPDFYENRWMLQDPDGNFFGIGPEHSEPLLVKIQVPMIFKPKPI